jgi:hypothetical protein
MKRRAWRLLLDTHVLAFFTVLFWFDTVILRLFRPICSARVQFEREFGYEHRHASHSGFGNRRYLWVAYRAGQTAANCDIGR